MPANNKKKKKPAVNPARGFATTSTQSKSRPESIQDSSADVSGVVTPNTSVTSPVPEQSKPDKNGVDRELHELSPEELEAQLETSELQQFVEKHAAKVRKDASRQVSRLQTEKRLLRGQADYFVAREWLPDELMQEILEFTLDDSNFEEQSAKGISMPTGDELVARIWNLQLVLTGLDIPKERIVAAVEFVLKHPAQEEATSQAWGLVEALDWLALRCGSDDLVDYEAQKKTALVLENVADEDLGDQRVELMVNGNDRNESPLSDIGENGSLLQKDDKFDVSDIESDLEPDQLLSTYLRTKLRLYELNPSAIDSSTKKKPKAAQTPRKGGQAQSAGERKLQEKLLKIEGDVLFDQREADLQWGTRKIELAREVSERKKLQLSDKMKPNKGDHPTTLMNGSQPSSDGTAERAVEEEGPMMQLEDTLDNSDMLGTMFDAIPGTSEQPKIEGSLGEPETVILRDFGRITGMHPRRILEESCRSRDAKCKIVYKQVSATTFTCRHSVAIEWTKDQAFDELPTLPSVTLTSKRRITMIMMMREAVPDTSQSEAYAATAALFLLFSGSPKEEKAHLRLPPAFRDLWDEFSHIQSEHNDALDRETVKDIRKFIEATVELEEEGGNEEVVFNSNLRRLNGGPSGASTPASRPQTPLQRPTESAQLMKDVWTHKSATPSYQRMLSQRANLPMFHARSSVIEALDRHQITIVVGDTGSGKSTQLPQFILEHQLSQGRQCKIYCTQPRRISAISLAQRVSEELGEHRGDLGTPRSMVGYAIRLESQTAPQTRLVYATVGIVLRMLENKDGLQEITHLVLDEVHERNIDTDFLLIVLRSLLDQRPDLKVILMSATVDAQKFSKYLDGAPIISVPGRTFPVQARFLEDAIELTGHTNEDAVAAAVADDENMDSDRQEAGSAPNQLAGYSKRTQNTLATYDEYRIDHSLIVKLLVKMSSDPEYANFSRAILIFLPGIADIKHLSDVLGGHPFFSKAWKIHALHSTFSSEDQQAAFEIPPAGVRKIVLATNIAETGITIPDVTCVIDTGKHREMRFDERRQMSRLIQSFIAKANAKQRRGRAGRVQEGICFHLFTKQRFETLMVEQQTPEMLRLSLQDLVMRVKICKLGDIETTLSQALDPPSSRNIRRAIDALIEVGALTETEQLTSLGTQLAKIPLDAQLGKLILLGATFGCLDFALTVAAALSSKTPFLSPINAKKQADSVRLGFKRGDSDLLTLYNAYSSWRKVCTTAGLSEYQFCSKNFLSPQNMSNIEDLKAQLLNSLSDTGFVTLNTTERTALMKVRPGSRHRSFVVVPARYCTAEDNDFIATSVVAWSFYPKIVKQDGKGWRSLANNQSIGLHPTSVNKHNISADVNFLSFYSIMQSTSKFTNAQETSAVSAFALILLAGDAVFHMFAGVIVVDGNRVKFKVRDWKTMIALKMLRMKVKDATSRLFKHPGRELGGRQKRWMELVARIFDRRQV